MALSWKPSMPLVPLGLEVRVVSRLPSLWKAGSRKGTRSESESLHSAGVTAFDEDEEVDRVLVTVVAGAGAVPGYHLSCPSRLVSPIFGRVKKKFKSFRMADPIHVLEATRTCEGRWYAPGI